MADPRDMHEWPELLEPLRPVPEARFRMHAGIAPRARELLAARRVPTWQDVAARWAGALAPLAAVLALVCGTLAYRTESPPPRLATLEELVRPAASEEPPELLTASTEPSRDGLLAAIIDGRAP